MALGMFHGQFCLNAKGLKNHEHLRKSYVFNRKCAKGLSNSMIPISIMPELQIATFMNFLRTGILTKGLLELCIARGALGASFFRVLENAKTIFPCETDFPPFCVFQNPCFLRYREHQHSSYTLSTICLSQNRLIIMIITATNSGKTPDQCHTSQ